MFCVRGAVDRGIFIELFGSAYGNRNGLFLVVPGDPSLPLGGRFVSPGVCRLPAKFVGVAVVDLVFRVYAPHSFVVLLF